MKLRLNASVLTPYLPPPWLARGPRPGEWLLLPPGTEVRLLHLDACSTDWDDLRPRLAGTDALAAPNSAALRGWRLALAAGDTVFVWTPGDGRLVAAVPFANPGPVTFAPWDDLIVAGGTVPSRLHRFSPTGELRGIIDLLTAGQTAAQQLAPVQRLAPGRHGTLWVATSAEPNGPFDVWRVRLGSEEGVSCAAVPVCLVKQITGKLPASAALARVRHGLFDTGLITANDAGFAIKQLLPDGTTEPAYFHRDGSPARAAEIVPPSAADLRAPPGTYHTYFIDSGLSRCRWHRVRIDADLPDGTSVSVAVLTSDEAGAPPASDDLGFWQQELRNELDFLVRLPPGRYLHLALIFEGKPAVTPTVHRIRLDYPRLTSLEQLPLVYRSDPEAEDFTERFLALFDALTDGLDRAVERFPTLLAAARVPEEALPWIGSFLGVTLDPGAPANRRRAIVEELPGLFPRRGTTGGLLAAVRLFFGVTPALTEEGPGRPWAALGTARLGAVRVYGKSQARFRLGRSALGAASLRTYGDPDLDPLRDGAHRFTLGFPHGSLRAADRQRLLRLLEEHAPAHTVPRIRLGAAAFTAGRWSAVGLDTVLAAPPPPVLGGAGTAGSAALSRTSILRPGPRGGTGGFRVGRAAVGLDTLLE